MIPARIVRTFASPHNCGLTGRERRSDTTIVTTFAGNGKKKARPELPG